MNRLVENGSRGNLDQGGVLEESRVQGYEGMIVDIGQMREVLFKRAVADGEPFRKRTRLNAVQGGLGSR